MMSTDELRELSATLRAKDRHVDEELVDRIEADVVAYRDVLAREATQSPPAELAGRLPLMGWLIYESTWDAVQRIETSFDRDVTDAERRAVSEEAFTHVDRLADCARQLPWPEFAPRALGALRAIALGESKRDTETGYDAAWVLHVEARTKHKEFRDNYGDDKAGRLLKLSLDEVFLQLALAETGTACRTAERVIARWAEQFEDHRRPEWSLGEQQRWIQRMFRELTDGLTVGEQAIATAKQIEREHGLAEKVDEHRLALRTALQNPGIMTARAASLLLAIGPAMQSLGRKPPAEFASWEIWEKDTVRRFVEAYTVIEVGVHGPDGGPAPMDKSFRRQLVHVRLNLALLKPGYDLPSARAGDLPCLAMNPLDAAALEAMSQWLEADRRGKERALGAATMPLFIRSLVAGRGLGEDDRGYREWRIKWFGLDQYSDERDRLSHMHWALTEAG